MTEIPSHNLALSKRPEAVYVFGDDRSDKGMLHIGGLAQELARRVPKLRAGMLVSD